MQLKTALNRVQKFKSFVYGPARWVNEERLGQRAGVGGFLGAGTSSSRESTGCRVSAITPGLAAGSSALFLGLPCLMYEPLSAPALEPGAALRSANRAVTIWAVKNAIRTYF